MILFSFSARGQVYELFEARQFEGGHGQLNYRILPPPESSGQNQRFPLLIFLHGSGERGSDNEKQLVHVAHKFVEPNIRTKYPAFVIFPQCPQDQRWSSYRNGVPLEQQPDDEISQPAALVMQLVDQLTENYPIDQDRIYIAGLSMGGFGTWDLISRFPQKFAAAVPVCGGGNLRVIEKAKQMPVWAAHGSDDATVPVTMTREMIDALRKAGATPIYTEFRGVGHNSWDPLFVENPLIFDWMFAQKRK